jgi:hypothetical protein
MNLHDPGVGNQNHAEVSAKGTQQTRDAAGIGLQRIGDQVGLFLIGMAAELGTPIQVQFLDYLSAKRSLCRMRTSVSRSLWS